MPNIKLSPSFQAYAQGVTTANEVRTEVEVLVGDGTYDQRAAIFWLKIGQRSVAYTEQDVFDAFIAGAMTRQPERTGVLLEVDTSGPTFNRHDPEAPGYDFSTDDADFRSEVAKVFRHAIGDIRGGFDEGKLYDSQGRPIGRFRINHD